MTFKDGADQNRLRTLGKRVPEEIFVAGFSGTFARFFCKKKERLKRQKIAFVLSFKWLWQSLALVGSDKYVSSYSKPFGFSQKNLPVGDLFLRSWTIKMERTYKKT